MRISFLTLWRVTNNRASVGQGAIVITGSPRVGVFAQIGVTDGSVSFCIGAGVVVQVGVEKVEVHLGRWVRTGTEVFTRGRLRVALRVAVGVGVVRLLLEKSSHPPAIAPITTAAVMIVKHPNAKERTDHGFLRWISLVFSTLFSPGTWIATSVILSLPPRWLARSINCCPASSIADRRKASKIS